MTVYSKAPGRINIIGEHTDYNDGFVLPASIDRYIEFTLAQSDDPHICKIEAVDLDASFSFDLRSLAPIPAGWENYVMGVVSELLKLGVPIQGFNGSFGGTVPRGGGVSSSAALENSLALGLLKLFPKSLTDWQIIKACQKAEHNFPGMKCGIMDQFSSMLGKSNHVMLLDCRNLDYKYFRWEFPEHQILLLNTNVSHQLASSEYNTRRSECQEGVAILQKHDPTISSLRDVSPNLLLRLQEEAPDAIYRRCRHVVLENNRVLQATKALEAANIDELGALMYQSHESLSKDYQVSCDELDFLVHATAKMRGVIGSRMMGGGFGGCTINLVTRSEASNIISEVAEKYVARFGRDCTPLLIQISNGAKYLNLENGIN